MQNFVIQIFGQADRENRPSLKTAQSLGSLPPLPISFEDAVEQLSQLPRMFVEMDGSLVWVGEQEGQSWQLDGMLYDFERALRYVELKGSCPRSVWEQLLSRLNLSDHTVEIHLTDVGRFIDRSEFEREYL